MYRKNDFPWLGLQRAFDEVCRTKGRRKSWVYRRMNITASTWSVWMKKQKMPLADFWNLCEVLDVDPCVFLGMARAYQNSEPKPRHTGGEHE